MMEFLKGMVDEMAGIVIAMMMVVGMMIVGADMVSYYSTLDSNYKTPWYSNSWTAQPYTMLMLSGEIHVDYWSKNGVGDDWLVRVVRHKGKSFWTVLEEK